MSAAAAEQALADYAAEPGRSALVRVSVDGRVWEGGVAADAVHPAASLLKLAVAIAAEEAVTHGSLDATRRIPIAELGATPADRSVLDLLDPARDVSVAELLGLMLGSSDNPCTRWLVELVGLPQIADVVARLECAKTTIDADAEFGVRGTTTCRDALTLLAAASDPVRHPASARALRHSIRNSRIPLGATEGDIQIAHKTGTLAGVAHDVAVLECAGGTAQIAFLTQDQHDTLVTGYAMGLCTRQVLTAWGLSARTTMSVAGG